MRAWLVAVGLMVLSVSIVVAQPQERTAFPPGVLLLIQSELDYLERADRTINIDLDEVRPDRALERIASIAGLSIEVDGTLPDRPVLTGSFRNTTVKKILTWYAEKLPVIYKTKSPDRLVVLVRDRARRGKQAAG